MVEAYWPPLPRLAIVAAAATICAITTQHPEHIRLIHPIPYSSEVQCTPVIFAIFTINICPVEHWPARERPTFVGWRDGLVGWHCTPRQTTCHGTGPTWTCKLSIGFRVSSVQELELC